MGQSETPPVVTMQAVVPSGMTLGQKLKDPERVADALHQGFTMDFRCKDEAHRKRLKTGFLIQFLFGVVICFLASFVFAVALAFGFAFPPLFFAACIGVGFSPMLYACCANGALNDAEKLSGADAPSIPSATQNVASAGPICCRWLPEFGANVDQEAAHEHR
jgi:hypothetical protein